MAVDSTTFTTILAALADTLGAADGVDVYPHEPRELDALPAATIVLERAERAAIDLGEVRRESQIGSVDLRCAWTVRVWCRGDALKSGEAAALGVLGQVVAAVDADEQLGGVVESATVESVSRERVEAPPDSGREFVTFVLTVVTSSLH